MIAKYLPLRTIISWDCLTEDMLWKIATNYRESAFTRHEAMQRWLYPTDYGYSWAIERLKVVREAAHQCAGICPTSRNIFTD